MPFGLVRSPGSLNINSPFSRLPASVASADAGGTAAPMYVSDRFGAKFGTVASWRKLIPASWDRHTPSRPLLIGSETVTYTVLGRVGARASSIRPSLDPGMNVPLPPNATVQSGLG